MRTIIGSCIGVFLALAASGTVAAKKQPSRPARPAEELIVISTDDLARMEEQAAKFRGDIEWLTARNAMNDQAGLMQARFNESILDEVRALRAEHTALREEMDAVLKRLRLQPALPSPY